MVTQSQGETLLQGIDTVFEFDADGNVIRQTDTELLPATSGFRSGFASHW